MNERNYDRLLDASGLSCPMPVVKARKEIGALEAGQVLKVISTDRGSVKDFQGWAKVDRRVQLLSQDTDQADGAERYVHYLEREA